MVDDARKGEDVVVRQVVEASVATAFEAWTTPEHVRKWWSPNETSQCTLCEIDFRVGGAYRIDMRDAEAGTTCKVTGEFIEISTPRRLVYTWNAETHEGNVRDALVTVTFTRINDHRTEVILRHSGLPDTPILDGHRRTWELILNSFADHAASLP